MKTKYNLGVFFIFCYCLDYSMSQVGTGHYEQNIHLLTMGMYIFLITVLFYLSITFVHRKEMLHLIKNNICLVIKVNVSTAFGWLTIVYALKYLEPAVALSINCGILPVAIMLFSFFNKEIEQPTRHDVIFSICLFIIIGILCAHLINDDLSTNKLPVSHLIFWILLCVISGIANAFNCVYSKMLSNAQFSATQVLTARFYLALVVSVFILLASEAPLVPSSGEIVPILLIAMSSVIIPIYLLQKGIQYSGPIAVALISPLLPSVTFFLELIDPRISFSYE